MHLSLKGAFLGLAMGFSTTAGATPNCFNVALFTVDTDGVDTEEEARASGIPEHRLLQIQQAIAKELTASFSTSKVLLTEGEKCPASPESLLISGKITDFKKGNKALRYLVGFGAGAQKVQVMTSLHKGDGQLVAEGEIVDRKFAGLIGGSENKGIKDFAEKVVAFVKQSLAPK
jgi:hypothetical protein